MTAPLLFIDANIYLRLYGMVEGKKLLNFLDEQKEYLFVTEQIVDEVCRNKVRLASAFLDAQIKDIADATVAIPDHLFGISDEKIKDYRRRLGEVGKVRSELKQVASETLRQVSRSEDEVSKRLDNFFAAAIAPNAEEMENARRRKERGNPPGKEDDPLGDQLTWEQLLNKCK